MKKKKKNPPTTNQASGTPRDHTTARAFAMRGHSAESTFSRGGSGVRPPEQTTRPGFLLTSPLNPAAAGREPARSEHTWVPIFGYPPSHPFWQLVLLPLALGLSRLPSAVGRGLGGREAGLGRPLIGVDEAPRIIVFCVPKHG